jgi:hypothetical protein
LDLLLGVQGWRLGFFYPQVIAEWDTVFVNMSYENLYLLQKIFAYKFNQQRFTPYSYYTKYYNGAGTASAAADAAP